MLLPAAVLMSCDDTPAEPGGPVAAVEVTPSFAAPEIGESIQLRANATDDQGRAASAQQAVWTSSNQAVAAVSENGLVMGVSPGTAIVTATVGAFSGSAVVIVARCSIAHAATIGVGETVDGILATTDCQLSDLTYADGYLIQLDSATNVQIDLRASFDTYLVLLEMLPDGNLVLVSLNDDVDPDDPSNPDDTVDTNSQILFTLEAGKPYFILANSFASGVTGDYELTVTEVASLAAQRGEVVAKLGKAPAATLLSRLRR
jgi:hypothetical protein